MIVLKGVNKYYNNGKSHVLKDISLEVSSGEFVSICGPSGHGKTTLLTLLSLLDTFDSGTYHIEGIDVSQLSFDDRAKVRAQHIGIVFQSFNLLGDYTVRENIALPLKYASHILKEKHEQLIDKAINSVELFDKQDSYPDELSGGQQQRVAIARALVISPTIIFADEPTGNLDSKMATNILDLLISLNKQGVTICMVTHDQRLARLTDRVIDVYDGRVVK